MKITRTDRPDACDVDQAVIPADSWLIQESGEAGYRIRICLGHALDIAGAIGALCKANPQLAAHVLMDAATETVRTGRATSVAPE